MKVLIAPDKFKGSLSAEEVCDAVQLGIHSWSPNAEITAIPMADGGEGTCRVLTLLSAGKFVRVKASDPIGRLIDAQYGISPDNGTAFIEMASTSGLTLLQKNERNPAYTSSVGTGQLIAHALDSGVKRIILGLGGSATNDCGIGMATALGISFKDANGSPVVPVGKNLSSIETIALNNLHPKLKSVQFTVLGDVTNVLYGPQGAAKIFAAQKGADAGTIQMLDEGLMHFANVVQRSFNVDLNFPGAGAAGGMGGGAKFFLNADFESGIDFIIRFSSLEEKIKESDLIISGEGKVDGQTLSGKVIYGIGKICKRYTKPFWVITGTKELEADQIARMGISRLITLVDSLHPLEKALRDAKILIADKIQEQFRSNQW
jgi:glycerate 2-kinase